MARASAERWATVVASAIGVIFIASGLSKLFLLPAVVTMFDAFHLPHWSLFVVGGIEIASGALVLIRRSRSYGALAVCCVMVGASLAHIMTQAYLPMIFADLAVFGLGLWLVRRDRPPFLKPDWAHDPHEHRTRQP